MRYTEHIKKTQAIYFERYVAIIQAHPGVTRKDCWYILEREYQYEMFSTYNSFRVCFHRYQKEKLCKKSS